MKKMLVLFSFFLFSIALSGVSEEKAAPVEVIQIVNFSGTIEIIYSDGTRFVIKSGEEVPPLMSGTMLRVLEGTLTLRVEDDVNVYTTGQLVRISEDMEGKWEAFLSDDTSAMLPMLSELLNKEASNHAANSFETLRRNSIFQAEETLTSQFLAFKASETSA